LNEAERMRQFWGQAGSDHKLNDPKGGTRKALLAAVARKEAGPPLGGDVGPWWPPGAQEPTHDETVREHPAGYIAGDDLVCAVNTALALGKPLLLTGNPGTGKSQLAERVAWELNMGRVLRFESQSLSEAQDLYYRFDLVGRLAAVEAFKAAQAIGDKPERAALSVARFLSFGALGVAILRAAPDHLARLVSLGLDPQGLDPKAPARASVVLVDEIDKTSRDFPNDLLNNIERKAFVVRELSTEREVSVPEDDGLHPIVIVTSNSERELPAPFLRRCIYYHIPDPDKDMLARILRSRVKASGEGDDASRLHPLYADMLEMFTDLRRRGSGGMAYQVGTSELLDLAGAMAADAAGADAKVDVKAPLSSPANHARLCRAASTLIKHRDDRSVLDDVLKRWAPSTS
jgi:MoxR-like ATPase